MLRRLNTFDGSIGVRRAKPAAPRLRASTGAAPATAGFELRSWTIWEAATWDRSRLLGRRFLLLLSFSAREVEVVEKVWRPRAMLGTGKNVEGVDVA